MTTPGLFDDLVTGTAPADPETPNSDNADASAETVEEPARETLTVTSLEQLPAGYVDIKTFAFVLTQRNMSAAINDGRTPTVDDMVDTQAVYAATRGKRWSLPALDAVDAEGTKLGLVIELDKGIAAWDARPERGTGSGAGMTPERRATRILRAGKARAALAYWTARVKRYGELLSDVGATWEDADEAYNQYLEDQGLKSEIKDDDAGNDD